MRDASKVSPTEFVKSQSQPDASTKSVDYFFDQPNAVRRPANRTATSYVPVLATFDADNAIILANEALLNTVKRNLRARRQLRDEDVETLTHEFARVLQYRDIFEDNLTQRARIEALRKRRARIVLRSTIESYTNHRLYNERLTEEVVQRVKMEILSSFDRAQHGSGLSATNISNNVEEIAAVVVRGLRRDFASSARREFARLKSRMDTHIQQDSAIDFGSSHVRHEVLSMRELRWLFPVKLSVTLADLVDEMISFDMRIVVPIFSGDVD